MTRNLLYLAPALLLAAAIAAPALAQPKPAASPAFEVISVKPNQSDDFRTMHVKSSGARFSAANLPLMMLVADALNMPFQGMRLTGLPEWTWRERFDIEAKAPDDVLPPNLDPVAHRRVLRALLQSLLADRFKMAIHRENKEMAFYALLVAKGGPKLTKASVEEKDCVEEPGANDVHCHQFIGGQGRGLHGKAVNMQDLVEHIENWTDHPVVNQTGLQGLFTMDSPGWVSMRQPPPPPPAGTTAAPAPAIVRPPSDDGDMSDPARPTLFMVLQKFGLELKQQKGPVEIIVVDHIERPTAN